MVSVFVFEAQYRAYMGLRLHVWHSAWAQVHPSRRGRGPHAQLGRKVGGKRGSVIIFYHLLDIF